MSEYLAVDVGGTQVKGALLDKNGSLVSGGIMEIPSKAKESKETILDNFFCLFESLSEKGQGKIEGMAFSFPGEFDYEQGISLISGLDKYDAIYGVNLKQEFRKMICAKALRDRFICPETLPICFLNDVEAFAMGAAGSGSETAPRKTFALAIGTGAGSAFLENGKAASEGTPGVPRNGWIYDTPFQGRRIDDWISKRGLMALSEERLGQALDGAELAALCAKGDEAAKQVYREFGHLTALAVQPFLKAFDPDECILGGQVMKSFPLFGEEVEVLCRDMDIALKVVTQTSLAVFAGLHRHLRSLLSDRNADARRAVKENIEIQGEK